jgi:signal transduction histidine kinase
MHTRLLMPRAHSSDPALARSSEPLTSGVLSAVSHDLRNPLGTILLGSTLLLNQLGHEPQARRSLEMIQRSALKIEGMIELLGDVAQLQGGLALELEDVSARELIDAARGRKALAEPIDDVTIHCDRKRLCRVLELALASAADPARVLVARGGAQVQIVIATTRWRPGDQYLARAVIAAHGGELWSEGDSVLITLPG